MVDECSMRSMLGVIGDEIALHRSSGKLLGSKFQFQLSSEFVLLLFCWLREEEGFLRGGGKEEERQIEGGWL